MAKDLGFQKVGVLIDKGTREDTIVAELKRDFSTYQIMQWNKNDIRDKSLQPFPAKEGYFNEHGIKKSPEFLDDYEVKLDGLKKYFQK